MREITSLHFPPSALREFHQKYAVCATATSPLCFCVSNPATQHLAVLVLSKEQESTLACDNRPSKFTLYERDRGSRSWFISLIDETVA